MWRTLPADLSLSALSQATLDVLCPYKGWPLYFTEGQCVSAALWTSLHLHSALCLSHSGFIEGSAAVEKIRVFEKYFTSRIHLYDKVCLLMSWL